MKKLLFSVATIFAANFAFGQINLEHSYPSEELGVYTNSTETFYYTVGWSGVSTIKIYNSDHTLKKQFSPTVPAGFTLKVSRMFDFVLSKNVFNTDNLLEIVVLLHNSNNPGVYTIKIYNEDGVLVKDFGDGYNGEDEFDFKVYHDNTTNSNKLRLFKSSTGATEIYNLGTTSLAAKEIQAKNKLSAFPIPTNKILNIINPQNGANKIEIFDTSGKLVINKSFGVGENKISIDVESLPKGIYIYKVGDLSSKFIKN